MLNFLLAELWVVKADARASRALAHMTVVPGKMAGEVVLAF